MFRLGHYLMLHLPHSHIRLIADPFRLGLRDLISLRIEYQVSPGVWCIKLANVFLPFIVWYLREFVPGNYFLERAWHTSSFIYSSRVLHCFLEPLSCCLDQFLVLLVCCPDPVAFGARRWRWVIRSSLRMRRLRGSALGR
jgi:hypothetical protein